MAGNPKVNEAGDLGAGELEHRFTNKNLTPQPPSLQRLGEKEIRSRVSTTIGAQPVNYPDQRS